LIPQKFKERNFTMVHPQYFEPIVDGMERVVIAGTGRSALIPDITVCGKTGTVENPHGIDHSTFIAFAPKENPQIAIAVYVENSGWGSSYAAPIASLIIEKYIKKEIQSEHRKSVEKAMMSANLMQKNLPKKEKSENEYD
jgi:penicillin-binding protein 2